MSIPANAPKAKGHNRSAMIWESILERSDFIFSGALIGIVFILVLPLPPVMLDLLLTISITLSLLIILTISYLKEPTDFFAFPTILLVVTLFRLGLNIATTRSILINGEAGHLIEAFGNFVIQGNVIVGVIVFIVLTVINFIVITKGAGRIAEVAARFTLDAMPGKQMAIDADLNAGNISEKESRERRAKIQAEASFYGSMDGASKFVRGDATAGLIITVINLCGGFAVGMLQMGLSFEESLKKFTLLTIGDGLVTQIPSLLISVAAGIIVTRSTSSSDLGKDFARQLFTSAKVMFSTGIIMLLMGFVPGFPTVIMWIIGATLIFISRLMPQTLEDAQEVERIANEKASMEKAVSEAAAVDNRPESALKVEPLALEIGLDLLPLVHGNVKNLLDRISALRRHLSVELGVVIPSIAVRDDPGLPPHNYTILLRGHQIAGGELFPGQLLAMGVGTATRPLRGRATTEPAFGLPATWISETDRREAERFGYAVVDPLSVLITHLSETLKGNAADMLTRQDVQVLLDNLKETNNAVIQEMKAINLNIGTVHRVMQNLLREGISVRELSVVLERICDQSAFTKNPDELSEACRKSLTLEIGRHISVQNNKVNVITMQPELEQVVAKGMRQSAQEINLVMEPSIARMVHDQLTKGIESAMRQGHNPILLCSPIIRLGMKRFFNETFPLLKVVAYNELSPKVQIQPIFTMGIQSTSMAA